MIEITLDGTMGMDAIHTQLAETFRFPDYYGRNLDALYDCLTELDETEIRFVNLDAAGDSYFSRVLSVFQEARDQNPRLRLSYVFE